MTVPSKLQLFAALVGVAMALTALLNVLERATGEAAPSLLEIGVDFIEALILVGAMGLSALAVRRLDHVQSETTALRTRMADASAAGAEWRRRSQLLLKGLGEAIEAQFRAWNLTAAEAEVATLIIKGLASKDIARLRGTSEATIRQQAQSVYRKSGLSNRAELAAYFLDDLFDAATHGLAPAPPSDERAGAA